MPVELWFGTGRRVLLLRSGAAFVFGVLLLAMPFRSAAVLQGFCWATFAVLALAVVRQFQSVRNLAAVLAVLAVAALLLAAAGRTDRMALGGMVFWFGGFAFSQFRLRRKTPVSSWFFAAAGALFSVLLVLRAGGGVSYGELAPSCSMAMLASGIEFSLNSHT